jgi:hypothetical protein
LELALDEADGLAADMASFHRAAMQRHGMSGEAATGYRHGLIKVCDMAVGVFPDAQSESGFSTHPIKGKHVIEALANGKLANAEDVKIVGVPCDCLEQAIALEAEFGDGAPREN